MYYNMFSSDLSYKSARKSAIYTIKVPELMIYSIILGLYYTRVP